MYSCNNLIAGQYIQIFEHSNKIEMHIDEKPFVLIGTMVTNLTRQQNIV